MSVVIQVDRLSKQYRLGTIGGKRLVDDVNRWWARFRGKEDPLSKVGSIRSQPSTLNPQPSDRIWALRDVSFEVKQGEVLGIIGRNGAGKSTLLKILSQVTAPTSGEVRVKGRIASLLEVGTGFHPELTGRENVFLNGAILGMTKAEIRSRFDEIVAFSEVEQFIDTPVKRYSSGMTVRLAFAVAAHLEPEILIVDEVLAVGDANFQKRCLGKMRDVAGGGRTVLFVSHNMVAVQTLCRRALLLCKGSLDFEGHAHEVVSHYLRELRTGTSATRWPDPQGAPGNDAVRLKSVAVESEDLSGGNIAMTTAFSLVTDYWVLQPSKTLHITYHLLNDQGITVLTSGFKASVHEVGTHRASCHIPGNLLNSGVYHLRLLVVENGNHVTFRQEGIASFEVIDLGRRDGSWMGREEGVIRPKLNWATESIALPPRAKDGPVPQGAQSR